MITIHFIHFMCSLHNKNNNSNNSDTNTLMVLLSNRSSMDDKRHQGYVTICQQSSLPRVQHTTISGFHLKLYWTLHNKQKLPVSYILFFFVARRCKKLLSHFCLSVCLRFSDDFFTHNTTAKIRRERQPISWPRNRPPGRVKLGSRHFTDMLLRTPT